VQVRLAEHELVDGVATDVDSLGRLVLQTADGELSVVAGDVEHVRSA
jgi:biotin-(acetyl-CoA carboxylase) ligase